MSMSSRTALGRVTARLADQVVSLLGCEHIKQAALTGTSFCTITDGSPTLVSPSDVFEQRAPATGPTESGSASTPTTRRTSSTASRTIFDESEWAAHLRNTYGIPLAIEPETARETFGPLEAYWPAAGFSDTRLS